MHEHYIEATNGDLTDVVTFCSDSCHQDWHNNFARGKYEGWNGSHEGSTDYDSYCAQCGVICGCGPDACEHQRENVVVNRFRTTTGEKCEHGNWIQMSTKVRGWRHRLPMHSHVHVIRECGYVSVKQASKGENNGNITR